MKASQIVEEEEIEEEEESEEETPVKAIETGPIVVD